MSESWDDSDTGCIMRALGKVQEAVEELTPDDAPHRIVPCTRCVYADPKPVEGGGPRDVSLGMPYARERALEHGWGICRHRSIGTTGGFWTVHSDDGCGDGWEEGDD